MAYSGGRDSTALLHATVATASRLGIGVVALHVHHGLSTQADGWLAHCEATCRRWARRGRPVTIRTRRLASSPSKGESVEAWARKARYAALRAMAVEAGSDLVLLAHHRRDQAETFVLQALRGGGLAGLSAMPGSARRDGVTWARPWLAASGEAVEAYARAHRLSWIDDDTNADRRFARNRLRLDVWPSLLAAFPDAEAALVASAGWAQQSAAVLDAVAFDALPRLADARGLDIAAWRALPAARQATLLRAWLHGQSAGPASSALVQRLMAELDPARARRWQWGERELHSYRGRLLARAIDPAPAESEPQLLDASRPGVCVATGWGGAVHVEAVERGGVAVSVARRLTLRRRAPGDRFQAGPGRPPRSLKLQFQASGISAAERAAPVLASGDRLVYVPGLGIDARLLAEPGEPQVALSWRPAGRSADPAG